MKHLIDKLLREQTDNVWIQLSRYFFVGGTAFVVDFGLLHALTEYAGLHYTLSATVAFLAGLTVNYLISVHWVFSQRRLRSRTAEFLVFGIIGVVGLALNVLIIWTLTEFAGFHYLASKIVATAIVFAWNFTARKYILFNRKR